MEAKQFVFRGSKLGPVGVEKAHRREEKLQQCLGVDGGEFSGFSRLEGFEEVGFS